MSMTEMPPAVMAAVYRGLEAADRIAITLHRLRHNGALPLPPMRLRARIGSRGAADFLRAGESSADALRTAARTHLGADLLEADRILDFGCGCGRTLRHFAPKPIEGCDVDAEVIAWMQRHIGTERFAANRFDPPLPWRDATFDLVYSVSIFTHLNEAAQLDWLREIARVLRPGGSALLTTQSEHALSMVLNDAIGATSSMKQRLLARGALETHGFIFEPYEIDTTRAYPGVREYGLTFHSHAYIRRVWSELFVVRGIDIGTVDGLQDVVVLTKR